MSVPYYGDYPAGATVYIPFNTYTSDDPSASVTMTNFVNTDVHIHKNLGLTQRNNAAGVTVDVDVDGIAGCHGITIDTSDNTVANFFVSGADYQVRIEGVTVDAATLNPFVGSFSLENRMCAGYLVATTIASLASQTSFTLTAGSADNDAYNGCLAIITDIASSVQKCIGLISDYVGSTKTVTLAADPGIFTMAAADRITIVASSALANVKSVNGTLQTANDNGADINAILTDTSTTLDNLVDDLESRLGTPIDFGSGTSTIAANLQDLADNGTASFDRSTDSLQAIRDHIGDGTNLTEAGGTGNHLTDLGGMSTSMKGEVQSECDDALVANNLDHLCKVATAAADMTTEVVDNSVISRIISSGDTSVFVPTTDSLQDIRDKLTDIETDTDVIDDGTSGLVKIASDVAAILTDTGTTLDTLIKDIPTVAEFNARSDPSGTAATPAEVNTEVDNALNTAIPAAPTADSINDYIQTLKYCLVNKMVITEANGNTIIYKDDDSSQHASVAAAFDSDGTDTTRKRLE